VSHCLTPIQQFFSYVLARTSSFSMTWGPLCTRPTLWMLIVLSYWNSSPRVNKSLHSDTLFWFRANQSLLFSLMLRA